MKVWVGQYLLAEVASLLFMDWKNNMEQFQDHNVLTDEVIVRDLTKAESAEINALKQRQIAKDEAVEANAIAKAALLDRLGITEDEAKLLLS